MNNDKQARIHRATTPKSFTLNYATAQDKSLSWEARGMLIYLLSQPADWIVRPADLEQQCGRDRVYRILNELIEARYIVRTQVLDEKKRFVSTDYAVHECPLTETPDVEIPNTKKPDITTEIKNTTEKQKDSAPSGVPLPEKPIDAPNSEQEGPKQTTELKNAVALLCHGSIDAWKSSTLRTSMSACLRALLELEPTLTADRIALFGVQWYQHDFRGKKGERPKPHQVPQEWLNRLFPTKGGYTNGHTPKPDASKPAPVFPWDEPEPAKSV